MSIHAVTRRATILLATVVMLTGALLPAALPFLQERASAADGATDVKMITGNPSGNPDITGGAWNDRDGSTASWALDTLCEGAYKPTVLDDRLISRALGPGFDNYTQQAAGKSDQQLLDTFYNSNTQTIGNFGNITNDRGEINQSVGLVYLKWLRDHLGQPVNAIGFFAPQGSAINTVCGGNRAGSLDDARFILVPVEGDTPNPTAFIGRQINVALHDCPGDPDTPCGPVTYTTGGVLRFSKPTRLPNDFTRGELDHYNDRGNYVDNWTTTIHGVYTPTGSLVVGNAQNAAWQDAAHINIEYVLNGNTFHEQYTDYRWDNIDAYFLSQTDQATRERLTVDASGQDTSINPLANPGSAHIPFINIAMCVGSDFRNAGINISYNDNGASGTYSDGRAMERFQKGIDILGFSDSDIGGCAKGASFYDYDANGAAVNPVNGLPAPVKIAVGNANNSRIWFYTNGTNGFVNVFTSASANEALYNGNYAQNTSSATPTYYDHNAGDCQYIGRLKTESGAPVTGTTGVVPLNWTLFHDGQKCQPLSGMGTVNVFALINSQLYDQQSAATNAPDDANSPAEAQIACDAAKISLSWLICPIAYAAISLAGSFDNAINEMMNISVNKYLNEEDASTPGPRFYAAWNAFRVFAMAIIVIAGLIMVMSQALGFDLLDAYTLKKILPRLLIVVIAIAVSWPLMKALIVFSDVLGFATRNLIYAPFKGLKPAEIGGGTADVLAILGGAAFLGLGAVGLLSFALTALLAVFIGFALLVFREMVVIFAVIVAPGAFALAVLPNTRKVWQFWQNTVAGALLMFPIVAGFIAVGHVFAVVAGNTGSGGIIGQFIFIIAYFAPYFLIPAAFRLAGGLVATVGGVVNDRSRGAFDRLKQYRANKVQSNMAKMATGERFNVGGAANPFNRMTEGLATFSKAENKYGFLTDQGVRQAAIQQQRQINASKYSQTERAQVAKENDPLLQGQTYENEAQHRAGMANGDWGDAARDQTYIERSVAAVRANGGYSKAKQEYAMMRTVATGTGVENEEVLHRNIDRIAGNNREMASRLYGEANAVTKNVGRHDLAPGYGVHMRMYDAAQANGGYQGMIQAQNQAAEAAAQAVAQGGGDAAAQQAAAITARNNVTLLTADQINHANTQAAKDIDMVTFLRQKRLAIDNMSTSIAESFNNAEQDMLNGATPAIQQAGREERARLAGMIGKMEQSGMYASVTAMDAAGDAVIDPTSGENGPHFVMQGPAGTPILVPMRGRQAVKAESNPIQVQVNQTTGQLQNTLAVAGFDSQGQPIYFTDYNTGQTMPEENLTHDAASQRQLRRHGGGASIDTTIHPQ